MRNKIIIAAGQSILFGALLAVNEIVNFKILVSLSLVLGIIMMQDCQK